MLDAFFAPQSVAVVGASRDPGKLGHAVLKNLISAGFRHPIYPINPHADEILGLRAYPTVSDIPGPVDLVVVVVRSQFVLEVLEDCGAKGVPAMVVITGGFKESGADGARMERRLGERARELGVRVIGPNCLGVMNPRLGLNTTFAAGTPPPGGIALMSQSGALAIGMLDAALRAGTGFSRFVSYGNAVDIGATELLEAWRDDEETRVILCYLEGVDDGRRFMQVAREVTQRRPVLIIKAGGTEAGVRAVSSHTGSLAGSDRAYDAAFRQAGVIRAPSVEHLLDYGAAFASQPLPAAGGVVIVTNGGGPGIMATDAVERAGLRLTSFEPATATALADLLPPAAGRYNPVDILGDAGADLLGASLRLALADPGAAAGLAVLVPQATIDMEAAARQVIAVRNNLGKPLLACFIGGAQVAAAERLLAEGGVPNYPVPERAVGALAALFRYRELRQPQEDPRPAFTVDTPRARAAIITAQRERRVNLTDEEVWELLTAYGFRIPEHAVAATAAEAARAAQAMGFPVAAKIVSPDIRHKSDIGGVRLGLETPQQVEDAFDLLVLRAQRFMPDADIRGVLIQQMVPGDREVILGMSRDAQFGPVILFGLGGIYVEVLKDVAFRVSPFGERTAREMVREVRSFPLLAGVRGRPAADLDAIVEALLRLVALVEDHEELLEMDVNPLKVGDAGAGAVCVDARATIAAPSQGD